MNKVIKGFSVAAAFATVAVLPAAAETMSFKHDGREYVADVTTDGNVTKIVGKELTSGKPFTLYVRDGVVSGRYNQTPLSFRVPASAKESLASN